MRGYEVNEADPAALARRRGPGRCGAAAGRRARDRRGQRRHIRPRHTAEPGNRVAAVVVGSQGSVRAGYVSPVRYDQYSTARTIEEALGVAPFTANDEYAAPFNDAFTWRHR